MEDEQELYEDAMTILNDPRGMNTFQTSFLEGYFSAMYDEMHERWWPNKEITGDNFADMLDEIWQRPNAIIEDDLLRRRFCLLCQKVIEVFEW